MIIYIYMILAFCTIRNCYTLHSSFKTGELISEYTQYLIRSNKYSLNINYYEELKKDYWRFAFQFWVWNWRGFIKSQYKDLLNKFEQYDKKFKEKEVKDVIYDDFKEMK